MPQGSALSTGRPSSSTGGSGGRSSCGTQWSDELNVAVRRPRRDFPAVTTLALAVTAAVLLVTTGGGCARSLKRIDVARQQFVAGDAAAAQSELDRLVRRGGRNARAAELDLAVVELAAGQAAAAEARLRRLRDEFDQPELVGETAGNAASMVSDDNSRPFHAAGYEQVMIRTLLAVCSLARDSGDVESYLNQAVMKQNQLKRQREQRMLQVGLGESAIDSAEPEPALALAPYLRGVIREASHHDYDDAQRHYRLVGAMAPQFRPAAEDLQRATVGVHSSPGHGVLYVLSLVGRGPVLEPVEAPVTSVATTIAAHLINLDREDNVDSVPLHVPVKVPRVVVPSSDIQTIAVETRPLNSAEPHKVVRHGVTQPLTDVATLARHQNESEMPWTIARAVSRRIIKHTAVSATRRGLDFDGVGGTLFQLAASTAWTASEQADLRCWGLLPREIQVLRAELPVGDHQVSLTPTGAHGTVSLTDQSGHSTCRSLPVLIEDARNTYVVAIAPDRFVYIVPPARFGRRGSEPARAEAEQLPRVAIRQDLPGSPGTTQPDDRNDRSGHVSR